MTAPRDEPDVLIRILESRLSIVQRHLDGLWTWCEVSGAFAAHPPLRNHLMWREHELSRNTHAARTELTRLRRAVREAVATARSPAPPTPTSEETQPT